jgi:predicted HTH transcriptional regulator
MEYQIAMGLPVNINDLLHGHSVEWERLEFKRGWNPEAILHTLCAFANDFHNLGGGYIFVGIADKNGRSVLPPEGIAADRLEGLQKELLNLGYRIQPHYHPLMIPYVIDGRHTLALWAPGGQNRPYKAPVSLSRGNREYAYFIRKGPNTVRAKGSDETELLSLAANVPFDDRLNRQGRVEDLSRQLMRDFLNETVIKHPDRAEATRVANFPYEAVEEALVNAVYHRSYEIREPVEVRITAEDLVVLNFPGPDPSIRLDQLKKGRAVPRRYRNRRIGEFLKELDLTEGRATGIPKILRAMRENGSPAPEFLNGVRPWEVSDSAWNTAKFAG